MSLENYFKNSWLKKEATSSQEIADVLRATDGGVASAKATI